MKPFVLIFTIALLAGALNAGLQAADDETRPHGDYYQCSMHPQITSDKPGTCPVCGMNLTKAEPVPVAGTAGSAHPGMNISPERQKLIGVTKDTVRERDLIYTVTTVGHVAFNPDIAQAFAEYREAYAAYSKSRRQSTTDQIKERAMKLMEIATLKLRLAGLSSEQFEQIKAASYDTGIVSSFFSPKDLILPPGHVWVDADLYEPDSELVHPGQAVKLTFPALPGQAFQGTVRSADAILTEFPRKVRIRIEVPEGNALKAGMAADVSFPVEFGLKLAVPESSVLESGQRQTVFVAHGDTHIEPREVLAGRHADGFREIIAGLKQGDVVVTSAGFLIDSESRLREAARGFSKKGSKEAAPSAHVH